MFIGKIQRFWVKKSQNLRKSLHYSTAQVVDGALASLLHQMIHKEQQRHILRLIHCSGRFSHALFVVAKRRPIYGWTTNNFFTLFWLPTPEKQKLN